jgi:site-specific DNA-cytosine methylase
MTPLCIDLFAGMFGFSAGWLELGGRVIGFDLEHLPHHVEVDLSYPI